MKVLYIAPYRTESDYGIEAQAHLQNLLASQHTITSRPIYLDLATPTIVSDPLPCESELHKSYDILIQQAPTKWLQPHPGFKTNIAVPMMDSSLILRENQSKTLNRFDKVLIGNTSDEVKLVRSDINNIIKISYPIVSHFVESIKEQKINLGIHNQSIKFYLFANMHTDADIIQKAVVSFYTAFRGEYGKSLILLLDNASESDKKQFMEVINSIKQQLHIFSYPKSTTSYIMFKTLSFQEKLIVHNTCDVFLSLNNKNRSALHENYAKFMNNIVLDIESVETVPVPRLDAENFETDDRMESIVTESLIAHIKRAAQTQPKTTKYENQKSRYITDVL